jgi:hypothetical protein
MLITGECDGLVGGMLSRNRVDARKTAAPAHGDSWVGQVIFVRFPLAYCMLIGLHAM